MGGLAGLVHFRGPPPARADAVHLATRQAHRGPDGEGAWAEHEAALAHRQRQVRPTSATQPLVTPDLVVLLDGWIYDHASLVRDLADRPDLTDVEALLLAWQRWGADTLPRLEGEFALAVWDRRLKHLTLARDRLGVRPLHYAARGDRLAFTSELPALLSLSWVSREPDPGRLAEYLSFGVVHAPRTLLAGVHQVEPGSLVSADRDGLRTRTWWRLRMAAPGTPRPRDGDVIPRLQSLVDQAVLRRLPAGVPAGLYLSGGLGSAAIGAAARRGHRLLPSFTVSFADDPFPESPFAGRVANLLGLEHHEVTVGSAEIADRFDAAAALLGQPMAGPGALLQLALARLARRHVRIALSGDGGEELFGGRMLDGLSRAVKVGAAWRALPERARSVVVAALGTTERIRRWSVPADRFAVELGLGGASLFSVEERTSVLRDPALVRPAVRREVLGPLYEGLDADPINTVLYGFLRSSLGDAALARADRTAAAAGLDVRFPLLDREVVEAAAALPGTFKVRRIGGSVHTRWPLRMILAGELPEVLVDRPKRGAPSLPSEWLTGLGRPFLEERCARLVADPRGWWRPEAVRALLADAGRSTAAASRLWALFSLDAWVRSL